MKYVIQLLVVLFACTIGKICGMGGGVIIKPALDALGLYSVEVINFYSACTVIAMSGYSVLKSMKRDARQIDIKMSSFLAIGAAIGGFLGKAMFKRIADNLGSLNLAGAIQALVLLLLTFLCLIYTLKKNRVKSLKVANVFLCVIIGFFLGGLGSFLGIGGGPFNMVVLYLFFSMNTKTAAENSLYIILISQLAGVIKLIISGTVPTFSVGILLLMMIFGILGSEIGSIANKKLSEKTATRLFELTMLLVMALCVYNAVHLGLKQFCDAQSIKHVDLPIIRGFFMSLPMPEETKNILLGMFLS